VTYHDAEWHPAKKECGCVVVVLPSGMMASVGGGL
jgi:hypothetical protein